MSGKRIAGIVVLIIGIVLVIFAVYNQNRVTQAKSTINEGSGYFGNSEGGSMAKGFLEGKAGQYDTTLKICLYAGVALVIIGGAVTLFSKKRSRK
jgi:uncharacterized membrane protein